MIFMEMTRCRKWLLTINRPIEHDVSHESIKKALEKYQIRYMAMCDETGSQGTYHIHLYIYFENAIIFKTLKQLFPSANIQAVKGTSEENRNYILKALPEHNKDAQGFYCYKDSSGKEHKGQNHTATFEEIGDCPEEHRGKRNDLIRMYQLVKEGMSNSEILEICPETAIKHVNKLDKLRHDYLINKYKSQRRLDLKVHYVSGKTGSGKSRDILDMWGDENVYRVTDYQHPFDSFQNELVMVFEEFRSSLRLQDMLNYLDIYPVTLPARYAPKVATFHTVYVVSNWSFKMQYAELQKDRDQKPSYEAWVRRFNGEVKIYGDNGITVYPTMQDYLNRDEGFQLIGNDDEIPFD